ncbi:hypothetical protein PHYPO_G00064690 [Pangasianodon hypophthalmus]|uniref:Melanoma antigen recognized by T-cells 1 n=1 Tax=Pangasianodon hypophthalmus TaxID=310915 RepID=A0A5N5M430_PANHP|nr:hypothetical protein PHYPO_G00064690 [Pangasianodon hypophthalmus]
MCVRNRERERERERKRERETGLHSLLLSLPNCVPVIKLSNNSGAMPRGDFTVHFASRGHGTFIRAEEAAGIAFLAIVLTALFILGCWYYRKRSGYRMIQHSRGPSLSWRELVRSGQYSELGAAGDNKMALNEFSNGQSVFPNAPPAYEKIATGPSPPPYSP